MVGEEKILQRRRGQRTCRTGINPDKGLAWGSAGAPRPSQWATRAHVWRRKERAGWEGFRPRDQRRSVQESGTRLGSLRVGAASSQEQCSLKTPPQGLATSHQAVVSVRERKPRQKGEGFPAIRAATAPDPNPVVILIVGLLTASSVADDRIAFTNGASPQDKLVAVSGPVGFELVRRGGKWDKKNRSSSGLCSGIRPGQGSEPQAEPLLLKTNPNWRRITLLSSGF
jgi:hypothetical protein